MRAHAGKSDIKTSAAEERTRGSDHAVPRVLRGGKAALAAHPPELRPLPRAVRGVGRQEWRHQTVGHLDRRGAEFPALAESSAGATARPGRRERLKRRTRPAHPELSRDRDPGAAQVPRQAGREGALRGQDRAR